MRHPRPYRTQRARSFRSVTSQLVFLLTGHRNYFRRVVPYVWGFTLLLVYSLSYALGWCVLHLYQLITHSGQIQP